MSESDQIAALATRLFDCIERGDVDGVAGCYAADLVVWHNFDEVDQPREANLATLAGLIARISERRYERRRLNVFEGGFVQQHVLTGVRRGRRTCQPAGRPCRSRPRRPDHPARR